MYKYHNNSKFSFIINNNKKIFPKYQKFLPDFIFFMVLYNGPY